MKKVWIITGKIDGFACVLIKAVLKIGDSVATSSLTDSQFDDMIRLYPHQLYRFKLDLNELNCVNSFVAETQNRFGRIDVLVNSPYTCMLGAAEAFSHEETRSQLAGNFYLPIEIIRVVLPYMREQNAGHIIQVSAGGEKVGQAGLSIFYAAKMGISGFIDSLKKEVSQFGIKIISVEPGNLNSDWSESINQHIKKIESYDTVSWPAKNIFSYFNHEVCRENASLMILELVKSDDPPANVIIGSAMLGIL